jgi:hypothetical protein
MKRSKMLMGIALAVAIGGCGSADNDAARAPPPKPTLTHAEVDRIVTFQDDVLGYCLAGGRLSEVDASNYDASMRAIKRQNSEYAKALTSIEGFIGVLRAKPDVMPSPDALIEDTPRHVAENMLSDQLVCDGAEDSTTHETMRAWRGEIRTVLAGLPPTRS